jgi:hypothetical protein
MDRKEFIDRLATQLREWDAGIDKFEAKAHQIQADTKNEFHKHVGELREKKAAAQERFEELKSSGDDAWSELKSGAELAFDIMKDSFQAAMSKFS